MTTVEIFIATLLVILIGMGLVGKIFFQNETVSYPPPPGDGWKPIMSRTLLKEIDGMSKLFKRETFSPPSRELRITHGWTRKKGGQFELYFYGHTKHFIISPFNNVPIYVLSGLQNANDRTVVTTKTTANMQSLDKECFVNHAVPKLAQNAVVYVQSGSASTEALKLERASEMPNSFLLIERFEDMFVLAGRHGWKDDSADRFFQDTRVVKNILSIS